MTGLEPLHYTVAAKTGCNPSHLAADGVKVFTVKKEPFHLGTMAARTPFGHTATIYGPQRTLCDMVRSRNSVELQVLQDALKQYVRCRDRNLHVLMEHAGLFHIERRLSQ